jgi:hypothetical protein
MTTTESSNNDTQVYNVSVILDPGGKCYSLQSLHLAQGHLHWAILGQRCPIPGRSIQIGIYRVDGSMYTILLEEGRQYRLARYSAVYLKTYTPYFLSNSCGFLLHRAVSLFSVSVNRNLINYSHVGGRFDQSLR